MALTERTSYFIGVRDDGQIEFRKTRVFLEDGEMVAEKHFREVLEPGQDVSIYPNKLRQIANIIWTPQVIAAYQAAKAASSRIGVSQ